MPDKQLKSVEDRDEIVWTKQMFATAKRLHELPPELQAKLRGAVRGPQKAPIKTKISIRLSPDVLTALRAKGRGWQTEVDEMLRKWVVSTKA